MSEDYNSQITSFVAEENNLTDPKDYELVTPGGNDPVNDLSEELSELNTEVPESIPDRQIANPVRQYNPYSVDRPQGVSPASATRYHPNIDPETGEINATGTDVLEQYRKKETKLPRGLSQFELNEEPEGDVKDEYTLVETTRNDERNKLFELVNPLEIRHSQIYGTSVPYEWANNPQSLHMYLESEREKDPSERVIPNNEVLTYISQHAPLEQAIYGGTIYPFSSGAIQRISSTLVSTIKSGEQIEPGELEILQEFIANQRKYILPKESMPEVDQVTSIDQINSFLVDLCLEDIEIAIMKANESEGNSTETNAQDLTNRSQFPTRDDAPPGAFPESTDQPEASESSTIDYPAPSNQDPVADLSQMKGYGDNPEVDNVGGMSIAQEEQPTELPEDQITQEIEETQQPVSA